MPANYYLIAGMARSYTKTRYLDSRLELTT
jgi:hypothetical protein